MADENFPRGVHRIEADLADVAMDDWAEAGVKEVEAYLAKHLAFLAFLDTVSEEVGSET